MPNEDKPFNQPNKNQNTMNLIEMNQPQAVSTIPYVSDKVDIQRLKGSNWATWKWQLQNVLDSKGLTDVLTGTEPYGSPREVAARQIISSSLDQTLVSKVIHCNTAQEVWTCLRGIYENSTSFALTDLIGRMNSFKMNSLEEVENGLSEIQSIACQIKALGGAVDKPTIESAILRALPKTFSSFITSWTFLDADKRTLENLHSHLMRTVCMLRSEDDKDHREKALYVRQATDKSRPKFKESIKNKVSKQAKKNLFCRYCKMNNHVVDDCRKLAKRKASEERGTSSNNYPNPKDSQIPLEESSQESQSSARVAYGHVATAEICTRSITQSNDDEYVTSTWIADSGASFHMTSHIEWLIDYREFTEKLAVRLGDSHLVKAYGKGYIETSHGIIDPVFYLPDISDNLFSLASCAKMQKIFALSTDEHMVFYQNGNEIFRGNLNKCGVYELNFRIKLAANVTVLSTSLDDWHERLAHISPWVIKYMADHKIVDGLTIANSPKLNCEPCALGKSKRSSHPQRTTPRATVPGMILHFDTIGPMPERSLGGAVYYVLCKDSYSSYRKIFFVSSKSDIPNNVKQILSQATIETGNRVLRIVTDNGTEYKNTNLRNFLDQSGITHVTSSVYTPEQNGLIERDIRTVAEAARTIRLRAGLSKPFWAEAMSTSVYILNRVINSRNKEKTPYELWFGKIPSLVNLHRFGESAVVHVHNHQRDKLDPKGRKLIFVGYTENYNTFRFINPSTNELVISCDAVFLNQMYVKNQTETPRNDIEDNELQTIETGPMFGKIEPQRNSITGSIIDENETYEVERCFEETIDNNRAQSREDISSLEDFNNETSDKDENFLTPAKAPPEQPDMDRMNTLRPRTGKPNYMPWKLNITTIEADEDPQNFKEAMNRVDKDKWLNAMNEELESLSKCKVWTLVNRPLNKNVVSNRWVLRIKRNPDGTINRYRARLVARGFSQIHGLDFHETYAPTASMSVIRLLIAYAAVERLKMSQFDIKTAFLYGDLDEEVYMSQPEGFVKDDTKVWRLNKSLYGLKQAPRQWCRKFTEYLAKLNLKTSSEDRCVFYSRDPLVIIVIYVDDGVIFARRKRDIDDILYKLEQRFEIHIMEPTTFLGFQMKRSESGSIILHQSAYVSKIIKRFKLGHLKPERSPTVPSSISTDDTPLDPSVPYRELVGSLLYAAICTRVDISYAVSKASRALAAPTVKDWQLVQRIVGYLIAEPNLALSYRSDRHNGLITYCDADHAGCGETARSTTGFLILFGGAPIHWRSTRQELATTSSTEAEIISLCSAVKDSVWLYHFALELGIVYTQPIQIYCDNESAIKLASNEKIAQRTKYLRARFAFIRDYIEQRIIIVSHVKSSLQLADMLTKAITIKSFITARNKMMVDHTAKALFVAMLILPTIATSFRFETIKPIIYQETDKFVDIGVEQYQIDYTYDNPCDILNRFLPLKSNVPPTQGQQLHQQPQSHLDGVNQIPYTSTQEQVIIQPLSDIEYVQTFINECHTVHQQTWLVKINELLNRQQLTTAPMLHSTPTNNRFKRGLVSDIIFGTVVTNLIYSAFEPVLPWSDHHKMANMAEFQREEAETLKKFQHDFNVSLAIQKGMLDLIKSNSKSIREQNRQMIHFAQLSSQITWLSTYIQTRIMFAAADIRTIIDEFTHHRVATLEMSELLNLTKIKNIDPVDTEFVSVTRLAKQTLRIMFNVRLKSPDTHVYRVHAFRYWDNLTHVPTMKEYQGSHYVLYNSTSNCSKGLEDVSERAVMDDCYTKNYRDPNLNIWRSLITTREIYNQDISTFKRTPHCNYVYCFPFNITIDGETFRCPSLMFKVPVELPFKINNISYIPMIRRIKMSHIEHSFIEDIPTGHFDESSIATSGAHMFDRIQELTMINDQLVQREQTSITIAKHGIAWWSTILTVGILILITICLSIINLRSSKILREQGNQVASDVAEMKIYDRISCVSCMKNASQNTQIVHGAGADGHAKVELGRDESITINVNPSSRLLPLTPSGTIASGTPGHRL